MQSHFAAPPILWCFTICIMLWCPCVSSQVTPGVFDRIYKTKFWGPEGDGSGPGSTVQVTAFLRRLLERFIEENNVTTIVDAPCGSFHWIPLLIQSLLLKTHYVTYTGIDIVQGEINRLQKEWPNDRWPNISFRHADITKDPLPQNVDLILSRDALQHLSEENVKKALTNYKLANPRFLILGGYLETRNLNIADGGYFSFSPLQPPYSLLPKYIMYERMDPESRKHLFVFDRLSMQSWNF